MFTAPEGLVGAGARSGFGKTPTAASVSNLNSLNAPHLHRASPWCASPFVADPLGPLCQMLRNRGLVLLDAGVAAWSRAPLLSGPQAVAWSCSLRSSTEVGRRTGVPWAKGPEGLGVGDEQRGT